MVYRLQTLVPHKQNWKRLHVQLDSFIYTRYVLSLDKEVDKRIAKLLNPMAKLSKRVWYNNQLTLDTKLKVYQACVLSSLMHGSESWTTYARQQNSLESFCLRCLGVGGILGITVGKKTSPTPPSWSGPVPCAWISFHVSLDCDGWNVCTERRMVAYQRMSCTTIADYRTSRCRPPALRFKDVSRRHVKLGDIDVDNCMGTACGRPQQMTSYTIREGVKRNEEKRHQQMEDRRQRRKQRQQM